MGSKMFNIKKFSVFLLLTIASIMVFTSCQGAFSWPEEPEADFKLSCARWGSDVVCEDYVESDPVTGYLKIWYYENDSFYGTTVLACGADLTLNTKRPFEDGAIGAASAGELICVNAADQSIDQNIEWSWESDDFLDMTWGNLYLSINISECPYEEVRCALKGYAYISVD